MSKLKARYRQPTTSFRQNVNQIPTDFNYAIGAIGSEKNDIFREIQIETNRKLALSLSLSLSLK